MHEHDKPLTSEVTQEQIDELVGLIQDARVSPYASPPNFEGDKTWIGATLPSSEDNGRMGNLVIEDNPATDPAAFLGVRHLENGFGDNRNETEILYVFSRDIEGNVSMKVSDLISTDLATLLLLEAEEFDESVANHSDLEMITAAKDAMQQELYEAFTLETHEIMATLKPGITEDYEKLKTLLVRALSGNKRDYELEIDRQIREWEEKDAQSIDGDISLKKRGRVISALGRLAQKITHS